VSEELEHSLQQAIETYLGERLRAIDEQLSRLQNEFGEALARLREAAANEPLSETSLSAAIFAHLQTARGQRLSGAVPQQMANAGEVGAVRRVVEEIERQQTHAGILGALLTGAAQFAERAALFVIRNEQAIGWRECRADDPANFKLIGGVSLPLSADTLLGRTAQSRATWTGAPGSNSEDSLLLDQLGGSPQSITAVPLVAREKVVAVLYADSTSSDRHALNVDALEVLVRVAAMAINLASAPRTAPDQPVSESAAVVAPAASAPAFEPERTYIPVVEPQAPAVGSQFTVPEVYPEPAVADVTEQIGSPAIIEVSAEPAPEHVPEYVPRPVPDYVPAEEATPVAAKVPAAVQAEPLPASAEIAEEIPAPAPVTIAASPAIEAPPIAAGFTTEYAAPLGSSRRYGVSEPELPIEVGEEERRWHNDARRFARLLVSEIKLYNEPKVKEGRSRSDLYDRLREDIDRSRQMYDKRVAPPVAARHDYFHQELVNTLAEGDPAKLGAGYPGAVSAAN